jgi:hypothetical protein
MWSDNTQQATSRERGLPADRTTSTGSGLASTHRKKASPFNSHTNDHDLRQCQSQREMVTAAPDNSQPNRQDRPQYQRWSQIPTAATNITPAVQHDLRCDSLQQTSHPTTEPPSYPLSYETHTISGLPVLSTIPSHPLGGDTASFNVGSTFAMLSSIPKKTRQQPQRFYENNSTVALRADIHNHVRGPLPPLPLVCGRCGRSDLDFKHRLKHQKSPYCLDLPAYKVLYAYVILGLPRKSILQALAQFDAATDVVGMRYVFRKDRIQALMAGCQDTSAWVRWFGHLPKFIRASAALDNYFGINSWPPPYPLDLPKG